MKGDNSIIMISSQEHGGWVLYSCCLLPWPPHIMQWWISARHGMVDWQVKIWALNGHMKSPYSVCKSKFDLSRGDLSYTIKQADGMKPLRNHSLQGDLYTAEGIERRIGLWKLSPVHLPVVKVREDNAFYVLPTTFVQDNTEECNQGVEVLT